MPDDCSTDDNEPTEEDSAEDEPLDQHTKQPVDLDPPAGSTIAASRGSRVQDIPNAVYRAVIPQIDGAADESSSDHSMTSHNFSDHGEDDYSNSDISSDEDEGIVGNDVSITLARGIFGACAPESIDLDGDSIHLTDLETGSIDLDSQSEIDHPSPTWNSFSDSDEAVEDVDDDMDLSSSRDDQEDYSDGDNYDNDMFLPGTSALSGFEANDGSESDGDHEPQGSSQKTDSQQPAQERLATAPSLPPLTSVFPGSQWNFVPGTYRPVSPDLQRFSSPSDAVLPKRRESPVSKRWSPISSTVVMPFDPTRDNVDPAVVSQNVPVQQQIGVAKSLNADFIEARQHNKITVARLTEQGSQPPSSAQPDAHMARDDDQAFPRPCTTAEMSPCHNAFDRISNSSSDVGASRDPQPHLPEGFLHAAFLPEPPLANPTCSFEPCYDHTLPAEVSLRAGASSLSATAPAEKALEDDDLVREPISAYELYRPNVQSSQVAESSRHSVTSITDQASPEMAPSSAVDSAPRITEETDQVTKTRTVMPTKRKSTEISEATEADRAWAREEEAVMAMLGVDMSSAAISNISQHVPDVPSGTEPGNSLLPSPPPSPEETVGVERPTKRMKAIAERVGYAALGGATVGAMVLTSLIYTAPSFV